MVSIECMSLLHYPEVKKMNRSNIWKLGTVRIVWKYCIMLSTHSLLNKGGKTRACSEENDQN